MRIEDSGAVQKQRQDSEAVEKQRQKQKEDSGEGTAGLYKKKNKDKNEDSGAVEKQRQKQKEDSEAVEKEKQKQDSGAVERQKQRQKRGQKEKQRQKEKDIQMGHARNFRDFSVWQESVNYCTTIYQLCGTLPWFEKKGIGDQLQRAAVSIPSNIAEGAGRPSDSDFAHYLDMALGSTYEVETQLLIAKNVNYLSEELYSVLNSQIVNIERQLYGLIRSVRQS